jgi:phosphoserine aminotransferase
MELHWQPVLVGAARRAGRSRRYVPPTCGPHQLIDGTLWRVEKRMDHALGTITDIFEAVLAHDSVALRRVLARAEEELRQLRPIEEVETLLAPGREEPAP